MSCEPALVPSLSSAETDALGDEIAARSSSMTAAMAEWLELVARFDDGRGWSWHRAVSCAHWLSWRCSINLVTAREHVRVARRLAELPLVNGAFRRGELSYSKVRAIARFDHIADEAEVVELALVASASQLERIVRATRRVTRAEAAAIVEDRHLDVRFEDDGTAVIHGRVPAEDGARLLRALAHVDTQLDAPADAAAAEGEESGRFRPPPSPARRADALTWMADHALASAPASDTSAGERTEVVVHVDARLLASADEAAEHAARDAAGSLDGPPPCATDEGAAIAAETARRLCCDGGIVAMVHEGDRTLAVGRRTRAIPSAIRRALRLRYPACAFPGCDRTRWLDAHHVEHWAHGGATELANLVQLCRHHHRLLHEGGWRLAAGETEGTWRAFAPNGRELVESPEAPPAQAFPGFAPGRAPDGDAAIALMPVAYSERYDLDLCVDAMLGWTSPPPPAGCPTERPLAA